MPPHFPLRMPGSTKEEYQGGKSNRRKWPIQKVNKDLHTKHFIFLTYSSKVEQEEKTILWWWGENLYSKGHYRIKLNYSVKIDSKWN